jgi:hypothetical protein
MITHIPRYPTECCSLILVYRTQHLAKRTAINRNNISVCMSNCQQRSSDDKARRVLAVLQLLHCASALRSHTAHSTAAPLTARTAHSSQPLLQQQQHTVRSYSSLSRGNKQCRSAVVAMGTPTGLEHLQAGGVQPWWKEGLGFECTQCGKCCKVRGNFSNTL